MGKRCKELGNGRVYCLLATPRRATLFFNTLPRAANKLMARQLTRKAENLFKHKKYETVKIAEKTCRVVFHRRGLEGLA